MNIKWEEGAPAPVSRYSHKAVWLNGVVYVGGGYEEELEESYRIDCYDPVNNLWNSPINTPYSLFALIINYSLLVG